MKQFFLKIITLLIPLFVVSLISLPLVSCSLSSQGTNTGNPSEPVGSILPRTYAFSLVEGVCHKIYQCFSPIDELTCQNELFNSSNMTSELGSNAAHYSRLSDLAAAETAGQMVVNASNFDSCSTALTQLDCADSLLSQAFSASTPADFSTAYFVLRTSAICAQIY